MSRPWRERGCPLDGGCNLSYRGLAMGGEFAVAGTQN